MSYQQGHRYYMEGQFDQALACYEKSLEWNPYREDTMMEMIVAAHLTGRDKKAVELLQNILDKHPNNRSVKKAMADLLSWNHEYSKAIALYTELAQNKKDVKIARSLAEIYLWAGQFDKAREVAQSILKDHPKDPQARLILGKSYHYAGQGEQAAKIYNELVKEKSLDRAQVQRLLGETRVMSKDFSDAVEAYQNALKKEPGNVPAMVALGDVLSWMGRYDESISWYEKVLKLQPGYTDVKVKMAKVYSWRKDYAKAEALYKEILDQEPRNKEAFLSLGEILTWDKKYEEARRMIDATGVLKGDEKAMLLYGKSLLFAGDYAASQKALKDIVDINPNNLEAKMYLADSYVYDRQYGKGIALYQEILAKEKTLEVRRKLAEAYIWSRQYEKGRSILNDILEADPKDYVSKLLLAKSFHYAGQVKEAEKLYQELLAQQAMNPVEIKALLADAYAIAKDYPHAIGLYEEILREDPGNEKVRVALGDVLSWTGKYEDSLAEYRRALDANPQSLDIKVKMATVLSWKKDFDKAEALFKEILAKDPKNREALLSLGEMLSWEKKYDEARRYLDAARSIKDDSKAKMLCAKMDIYSGNISEAKTLLEELLKEDPENAEAQALLAESQSIKKEYAKAIASYQEVLAKQKTAEVQRKLAETYIWDRQYAKARTILQGLLEADPKDFKAQLILAQSYHYAGETGEAAKIYEVLLAEGAPNPLEIKAALGEVAMIAKDYAKAIAQWEDVLKEDPQNVHVREGLADVLSWTGKYYDSVEQYRKILAIEPENLEIKAKMAKVYSWRKDLAQAEALYKEILQKDPRHRQTLVSLGEILTWAGKYHEAMEFLGKALQEKEDATARILYASALLYSGDNPGAQKMLQGVLDGDPENLQAKTCLADACVYDKQYDKGIALYQEILGKEKSVEVQRKLAEAYVWSRQYSKAREILNDLLKKNPKDSESKLLLAKSFEYAGQEQEAERIDEELLEEGTVNPAEIKVDLAETYMIAKDYPKAIAQCEGILKEDPTNKPARTMLADMFSWTGRYEDAIAQYEQLLKADPDNFGLKVKMASIYFWKKDFAKAQSAYQDILAKDPKNREALLALGELLTSTRSYKEARQYLEKAMAIKTDARAKLLYAQMLLYSGDNAGSYKLLQEVVAEEPNNAQAKISLADAYAYNKEFDKAVALYKEVLSKQKNFEVLRKMADVLSWARKYDQAIAVYDEALKEEEAPQVQISLQKARVLGWAKRYGEALKAYRSLYEKTHDPAVELEWRAKEHYWNGWVQSAIQYYCELIQKDPRNVEAMFDLSQIYSYQSMWPQAMEEYNKILDVAPAHFRAREGLQKAELISKHLFVQSGYEFVEALSIGRDSDVHKHSFYARFRQPVSENLTVEGGQTGTVRAFSDFDNVVENESRLAMTYQKNPTAWMDGYYDLTAYNRGIDPISQFGGHAGARIFDRGATTFGYARERLENSSTVIRDNFYSDNIQERLTWDYSTWIKLGTDYRLSLISDKNTRNEAGMDLLWYLSIDPKRLAVKYRGTYWNYSHVSDEYFSPNGFWTNSVMINWRHFLNKDEIFFGANDLYYDARYEIAFDAKGVTTHKVGTEIYWDITKQLSFDVSAMYTTTTSDIFNGRNFSAYFRYYF